MTETSVGPLRGRYVVRDIDGSPCFGTRELEITFGEDGRLHGRAVNSFGGPYEVTDGILTTGPLVATLMAGPPELMTQEHRLHQILALPLGVFRDEDGVVSLHNPEGSLTLEPEEPDAA